MNYTYSVNNNTVYCFKTYAGKTVRGISKCHPEDEFNLDDGRKLARARCEHKISRKKLARANKIYLAALDFVNIAKLKLEKAQKYQDDALTQFLDTKAALEDAETSLK